MNSQKTDISSLGEFGLIERLTKPFDKSEDTIKSVGDDCAVLSPSENCTLISTDFLVEGIHFDLTYTSLKHLGYKSVVVNLSDIYAMNGIPKHITLSLALSNRFSVEALEEFYEGVNLACIQYNVDLIGGDTTSSTKGLIISITAIGEQQKDKIVYRNTAKEGDFICLSGNVGAAYVGLQILEREKDVFLTDPNMQPQFNEENSYLLQRILKPEARKDIINFFEKNNIIPTSMIDVSDGVSSEIFHLCKQSNLGAQIEDAYIPIHNSTYLQAMNMGIDPSMSALNGGEDYELLFTIDPKDEPNIAINNDITIIGTIKSKDFGIKLNTKSNKLYDMKAQGWVGF